MDYINFKLFGILRGDSGKFLNDCYINIGVFFYLVSNKSSYIKLIREGFDFVESYFKEMFTDCGSNFN